MCVCVPPRDEEGKRGVDLDGKFGGGLSDVCVWVGVVGACVWESVAGEREERNVEGTKEAMDLPSKATAGEDPPLEAVVIATSTLPEFVCVAGGAVSPDKKRLVAVDGQVEVGRRRGHLIGIGDQGGLLLLLLLVVEVVLLLLLLWLLLL
jgi:hypothetical protein